MFPIDKLYHMDASNDNSSQKESNNDNNFAYELATKVKDKKRIEIDWSKLHKHNHQLSHVFSTLLIMVVHSRDGIVGPIGINNEIRHVCTQHILNTLRGVATNTITSFTSRPFFHMASEVTITITITSLSFQFLFHDKTRCGRPPFSLTNPSKADNDTQLKHRVPLIS